MPALHRWVLDMRWFSSVSLFFPLLCFAQLPNTFENGNVADADAVNANFQNLDNRLQTLEAEVDDAKNRPTLYDEVEVDCSVDPEDLNNKFYGVQFNDPTVYRLAGDCNFNGDVAGRSAVLTGNGDSMPKLIDSSRPDLAVSLRLTNSSFWLVGVELFGAYHVGFQNSHLRLEGVKITSPESSSVSFDIREGGIRFISGLVQDANSPFITVRAFASSVRFGLFDTYDFARVLLRNGSSGWCRYCDNVSIGALEVDLRSSFCAYTWESDHLNLSSVNVTSLSVFRHAGAPVDPPPYTITTSANSLAEFTEDSSKCQNF